MKSVRCNTLMKVLHLMVFLFGEISPTCDKKKTQCDHYKEFVLKPFKKFTIFPRKQRKDLPDLDSEFMKLT